MDNNTALVLLVAIIAAALTIKSAIMARTKRRK